MSWVKVVDGTIIITGFTDNTGSAAYNQELSYRRAKSVETELVTLGVPPSKLTAKGEGEGHPVASNVTPSGQALNRRVEISAGPSCNSAPALNLPS